VVGFRAVSSGLGSKIIEKNKGDRFFKLLKTLTVFCSENSVAKIRWPILGRLGRQKLKESMTP
jgi:hypothetical protein